MSELDDVPQSVTIDYSNGSPLNRSDFLIVHYNIDSITADDCMYELMTACNTMKIDCLVLTESKVDETIPSNLIYLPGYHEPLRHDRTRHGGGTLIYVAQHLTFKHQTSLQHKLFEHLCDDVKVCGKICCVNTLYKPSTQTTSEDHETFLITKEEILSNLQDHTADNYVFASDMNFGNVYSKSPKPLDSFAPDLFQMFGYTQFIDIPTHITNDCTSLIDLIYIHNIDSVTSHGILPRIADHEGIFVSFHCTQDKVFVQQKLIFDYTNIDEGGLINYIKKH